MRSLQEVWVDLSVLESLFCGMRMAKLTSSAHNHCGPSQCFISENPDKANPKKHSVNEVDIWQHTNMTSGELSLADTFDKCFLSGRKFGRKYPWGGM